MSAVAIREHSTFPTWKTIILGLHKTSQQYANALKEAGMRMDTHGTKLLGEVREYVQEEVEVDLVVLSVQELGLPQYGANYQTICARAQELGLTLCPAEVGPALRLQYPHQVREEMILIAMRKRVLSRGLTCGLCFSVVHDSWGRRLNAAMTRSDFYYTPSYRFVFLKR